MITKKILVGNDINPVNRPKQKEWSGVWKGSFQKKKDINPVGFLLWGFLPFTKEKKNENKSNEYG